jgi:hypothetical protein
MADTKQGAMRRVLALLLEAREIIHKYGLSGEFPDSWMAETDSLAYPPDEDEENPVIGTPPNWNPPDDPTRKPN